MCSTVYGYGVEEDACNQFSGRNEILIDTETKCKTRRKKLTQFMARDNQAIVVMPAKIHTSPESPKLAAMPVIARAQVGHRKLVLLANRETS